MGHIDAFVVDAGPLFRLFRYTPSQQEASLHTSPENVNISTFVLHLRKVPPGKPSVAVNHFKHERGFRLLSHIPHALVDDGAFFPLLLPEKITNQRSLRTRTNTTHSTFQAITVFRGAI